MFFSFFLKTFFVFKQRRETGNGKRETGNGKRETGNGKRETGNGKRETGNGKREITLVLSLFLNKGAFFLCF